MDDASGGINVSTGISGIRSVLMCGNTLFEMGIKSGYPMERTFVSDKRILISGHGNAACLKSFIVSVPTETLFSYICGSGFERTAYALFDSFLFGSSGIYTDAAVEYVDA